LVDQQKFHAVSEPTASRLRRFGGQLFASITLAALGGCLNGAQPLAPELRSRPDLEAHAGEKVRIVGIASVGGKAGAQILFAGVSVHIEDSGAFPPALNGRVVTVQGRLDRREGWSPNDSQIVPQRLGEPLTTSYWLDDACIEAPGPVLKLAGERRNSDAVVPPTPGS
jgi:hypothetical protein